MLYLHAGAFGLLWIYAYASGVPSLTVFFPQPEIKKTESLERLQFLIIEDAPEEEVLNPTHEAMASRRARDMNETLKENTDHPFAAGEGLVAAPVVGAGANPLPQPKPGVEAKPQPPRQKQPEPQPRQQVQELVQEKVEKRENVERTEKVKEISRLPFEPDLLNGDMPVFRPGSEIKVASPEEMRPQPEDTQQPSRQTEENIQPPRLAQKQVEKMIEFKPIGRRAERSGSKEKKSKSSSDLKGEKSFETLRGRYPAYMQKVFLKIISSHNFLQSGSVLTYNKGEVWLRFGIAPDGSLSKLEITHTTEGMIAHRAICEGAVKASAPFGPLEKNMLKDMALFNDIGIRFIY